MLMKEDGFTIIELIAVLVILGILSGMATLKFIDFDRNASNRVIDLAIAELNTREKLIWSDVKIKGVYDDDVKAEVWDRMQYQLDIGEEATVSLKWITVGDASARVKRKHTDPANKPAMWSRK